MLNLSQMRFQVYEMLGSREDLGPNGTPSSGGVIDQYLNLAQTRLAKWRFPDGHLLRFPALYDVVFFKSLVKTGTVGAITSTSVALDTAVSSTPSGRYKDWVVEITSNTGVGQIRAIVSFNTSRVATVHKAWDTNPVSSSSTYSIYKRFYRVVHTWNGLAADNIGLNTVADILKIEDLGDEREIKHDERTVAVVSFITDKGAPSKWTHQGDKIVFNTNVDDARWFRMEIYKNPTNLVAGTDKPTELGEGWDHVMVLYARWFGEARGQEPSLAYSAKKDFEDVLVTMRQDKEMGFERINSGVSVEL